MPKIFRLTKGGKLNREIFEGATINTPSMLCVEDYLDTLAWAESLGGLDALIARSDRNAQAVTDWVERTPWVDFLAGVPETRSNTSVCLRVADAEIASRSLEEQAAFAGRIVKLLEKEGVAYDIGAYRDAPPGLRLWCGATVETRTLRLCCPGLTGLSPRCGRTRSLHASRRFTSSNSGATGERQWRQRCLLPTNSADWLSISSPGAGSTLTSKPISHATS